MSTLHYFAYGSNLHPTRLRERVPSARLLGCGAIQSHVLRFHKRGECGSAKCNAHYTGDPADRVLGAVYELAATDKAVLDRYEGPGYETRTITVELHDGMRSAFAYIALGNFVDESLQPFHWYQALVRDGARYHDFLPEYIERYIAVRTVDDVDLARAARHSALLDRLSRA